MENANLKRRTGLQWQKPMFVGKKKRLSQRLSSERDSDSDAAQVNTRVRKREGLFSTRKSQDHPNEARTAIKEWNVLYTTQLTQKARKYHDGVLRLISGSYTNQVMLLTEDGTELSNKYLNSTDRIETGRDCDLPNYLIQICESRTIPVDNQNRNSGPVECGTSDEARSMDINLKSAHEWTALYTTQKTQQAKKYHDGIFRLVNRGSHARQIILLNEEGEVLNSRYLKSTESVESGCSYEFPNYLVEVCESKARIRDDNLGGSVEKKATCTSSKVGKSMDIRRVADHKSVLNEWNVLYTTQKMQKAKKYHDGILRLVNCGSYMKQIVLLNEEGDILNSRYLKSAEMVETGCSYEFPNYLVEVSELKTHAGEQAVPKVFDEVEANNKNTKTTHDVKEENSGKAADNFNNGNTHHNFSDKPVLEWKVMYTTQMTQKAKKYHDGVLQITDHGLQMKQAILFNEDGVVLSSKYFKSAGCIKSGQKFEFPNYLIETCEPCSPGRETEGGVPKKHLEQVTDCTISNAEVGTPISIYDQRDSKVTGNNMDGSTSVNNRQIRDASQILSFLRKPVQPHSTDIIVSDAASTYKTPSFSVSEPKEDILNGNATEIHDGHNLHPQSKHDTASLNQLSGKLSLGPQPTKQDIDHDYTENAIATELSCDHIHSSPKYVQKNLLKDSLASSRSPPEDIGVDKSRSLSDEIMNLQQEWTTLSNRALQIGNAHNHNSSLKNDIHVDEDHVADRPSCNKLESMNAEVKSISNVNDFPSFDLGFD